MEFLLLTDRSSFTMTIRSPRSTTLNGIGITRYRWKPTGVLTESTVSGIADLSEDHPLYGFDSDFTATTNYAVRVRRLAYPKGSAYGESRVNGQFRGYYDNLSALGLSPPAGFGFLPPETQLSSLESAATIAVLEDLKGQVANLALVYAERLEAGQLVVLMGARAVTAARRFKRAAASICARKFMGKTANQYSVKWRKKVYRDWFDRFYDAPTEQLLEIGGKKIAKLWLEYVFGWRPIIEEASSIVNAVSSGPRLQSVEFTRTRSSKTSLEINQVKSALGASFHWKGTRLLTQSVRAKLRAEMSVPVLATAASLGLTNPLSLAWELVPFSWVVAPFWDLGGWLSTLDATLGWTILPGSCVSRRAAVVGNYEAAASPPVGSSWRYFVGNATCSEETKFFERTSLDTFASLPSFRPPSTIPLVQTFANLQSVFVSIHNGGSIRGARV